MALKICVFGAGAIGGLMAAKLAMRGEAEVTVIARGPHLAAMQAQGLRLRSEGAELVAHPRCVATAAEAGPQDYVVVTLKAHSLPSAAPQMQPLLGPETAIVSAVNGVPWWYFHKLGGPHEGRRGRERRPRRARSRSCCTLARHRLHRLPAGRGAGARRDRAHLWRPLHPGRARWQPHAAHRRPVGGADRAGFKAPVRPRIRDEMWVKLWGNLAFNPISRADTRDARRADRRCRASAAWRAR
jgi:2-dehydropantoate 2-reductase